MSNMHFQFHYLWGRQIIDYDAHSFITEIRMIDESTLYSNNLRSRLQDWKFEMLRYNLLLKRGKLFMTQPNIYTNINIYLWAKNIGKHNILFFSVLAHRSFYVFKEFKTLIINKPCNLKRWISLIFVTSEAL